jgi:hypothetical protein
MGAGGLIARGLIGAYLAVMVSALWLAAADAVEDGNADVVLRNGKIYTADKSARSRRPSPSRAIPSSRLALIRTWRP